VQIPPPPHPPALSLLAISNKCSSLHTRRRIALATTQPSLADRSDAHHTHARTHRRTHARTHAQTHERTHARARARAHTHTYTHRTVAFLHTQR
jgi:hypothetical protein